MNILILNWRDPKHPNAGGAEQVTLEHAKGWKKAGYNVWWFSASFKGAKKKEEIEEIKIIRSGGQFFDVQIRAFFWYFFGKHPRFDLVVDQFHGIPFFTPLYVRVKKLAFIHEVAKEVWKLNPWPKPFNLIPTIFGTLLESSVFRLFYTRVPFMTVSESTKKDLISFGIPEENITVVHNGVDLSSVPKKLPKKERRKTAIYLGAIAEDKGFRDALKAFSEIKKKEKGWQFWMAGKASPEMVESVDKLVEKLNLRENFKFWGYVTDNKKFELLARAHVLINPSYHEGWGLVNIEAGAVGTPVVGYNVHGVKDSVRDNRTGLLTEKGDFRAIAESAIELISDKRQYRVYQEKSKKWAKGFSWEDSRKQSKEFIERLRNNE